MSLPDQALMDWLFKQLIANPLTLTELDLLRGWHLEKDEPVAIRSSYELFRQHFVMRNALYHLRQQLGNQWYLEIGMLYIRLHHAGEAKQAIAVNEALAAYYMNADNLEAETPESVAQMLEGFFRQWQRYCHNDRQQALSTLALPKDATQAQVKQQYRLLAMRHHPDRGGSEATFKKIQQAYGILKAV